MHLTFVYYLSTKPIGMVSSQFCKTSIHNEFIRHISRRNGLPNNSKILLTISGGQDSLCLLKLIIDSKNIYQWNIGLVHFDHKCRKDAYHNTKQFLNIANLFRIKTYVYECQVQYQSETASREWRYKNAFYIALCDQYSIIVTAHTKTDKVETFLHNILRGCGIDSLSSISYKIRVASQIEIVRPLIMFSRLETLWVSRKFGLPVWSDFTNYGYKTVRNRLREELLPYLQQYFQPNIHNIIQTIANRTQVDSEYIQKATIKLYFITKHPRFVAMDYHIILQQPIALQYRVFKLFFRHNFNMKITEGNISNIIEMLRRNDLQLNYINYTQLELYFTYKWLYVMY